MAFYAFDPNGNLAANLITNEVHAVSSVNGVDHNYLVPRDAPFFNASMVVVDVGTGSILTKGVDYDLAWDFDAGLSEVGVGLSGVVYFIDKNRSGSFSLRYQTLGGDFVTGTTRAIADGLSALTSLQTTRWDSIASATIPASWPATPHTHPVTDMEAALRIIDAINNVVNALTTAPPYIRVEDIIDLDDSYFTPMIRATEDIADAIRNNLEKALHYERFKLPTNPTLTLGAPAINVWVSTGLTGVVSLNGSYIVNTHFKPIFSASENPKFRTRFSISTNGGISYSVVEESYANGMPVGLVAGWFIRLEVLFEQTHSGCTISSDDIGKETITSMAIYRLGN